MQAADATRLTACAAVAVAEAIEALSGREAQIKWVNDIFVGGRKVCGILTEASVDCESGMMHYVIIGIGVNTHVPAGDFPEELRDIAGAAFGSGPVPELRCRLAAGILDRIMDYSPGPAAPAVFEGYKKRSLVLGKHIDILSPGREPESAVALELAEDYALIARMPDGSLRRLSSGEVSVKV
jgi:BirA family biotin operon repressor/biotin-[acetyl-CoA-carboxylase] ligase